MLACSAINIESHDKDFFIIIIFLITLCLLLTSTSQLCSGRGSGCESASGLLASVCPCQQQPRGPALPVCSVFPQGNPINEAAGKAKGSAAAVVQLLSDQML